MAPVADLDEPFERGHWRDRERATLAEPGRLAFVVLEHGATWHWTWARAHGFGFDRSALVAQRRGEPLADLHARVRRSLGALRRSGSRIARSTSAWRRAASH